MKFALVFPGQGSQSIGMMAAYGDAAVIRSTFDEASSALVATGCGRPGRSAEPDGEHPAADAHRRYSRLSPVA